MREKKRETGEIKEPLGTAIISECFHVVRMFDDCASCNILELTLGTDFGTDARRYEREEEGD